jgi:hypothetical protein
MPSFVPAGTARTLYYAGVSRQRDAVNALAEARRRLDTAQEQAGADE